MKIWRHAGRSTGGLPEGRNVNRLQVSAGRSTALRYGVAVGCVALAVLAREALDPILHDKLPFVTFFAGIAAAAWFGGLKPALLRVCKKISVAL